MNKPRQRRMVAGLLMLCLAVFILITDGANYVPRDTQNEVSVDSIADSVLALDALKGLEVKGRAPKTGYTREQFGGGWGSDGICDVRNLILIRDLRDVEVDDACNVVSGTLDDPYTGLRVVFLRGPQTSQLVQIDHVVALSDAWQKGAQAMSYVERVAFSNDPLNLLAVDGEANQQKGDGDAATWLPKNVSFRCQYVARQIAVKQKHSLWVTNAEQTAMEKVLGRCPNQALPSIDMVH